MPGGSLGSSGVGCLGGSRVCGFGTEDYGGFVYFVFVFCSSGFFVGRIL